MVQGIVARGGAAWEVFFVDAEGHDELVRCGSEPEARLALCMLRLHRTLHGGGYVDVDARLAELRRLHEAGAGRGGAGRRQGTRGRRGLRRLQEGVVADLTSDVEQVLCEQLRSMSSPALMAQQPWQLAAEEAGGGRTGSETAPSEGAPAEAQGEAKPEAGVQQAAAAEEPAGGGAGEEEAKAKLAHIVARMERQLGLLGQRAADAPAPAGQQAAAEADSAQGASGASAAAGHAPATGALLPAQGALPDRRVVLAHALTPSECSTRNKVLLRVAELAALRGCFPEMRQGRPLFVDALLGSGAQCQLRLMWAVRSTSRLSGHLPTLDLHAAAPGELFVLSEPAGPAAGARLCTEVWRGSGAAGGCEEEKEKALEAEAAQEGAAKEKEEEEAEAQGDGCWPPPPVQLKAGAWEAPPQAPPRPQLCAPPRPSGLAWSPLRMLAQQHRQERERQHGQARGPPGAVPGAGARQQAGPSARQRRLPLPPPPPQQQQQQQQARQRRVRHRGGDEGRSAAHTWIDPSGAKCQRCSPPSSEASLTVSHIEIALQVVQHEAEAVVVAPPQPQPPAGAAARTTQSGEGRQHARTVATAPSGGAELTRPSEATGAASEEHSPKRQRVEEPAPLAHRQEQQRQQESHHQQQQRQPSPPPQRPQQQQPARPQAPSSQQRQQQPSPPPQPLLPPHPLQQQQPAPLSAPAAQQQLPPASGVPPQRRPPPPAPLSPAAAARAAPGARASPASLPPAVRLARLKLSLRRAGVEGRAAPLACISPCLQKFQSLPALCQAPLEERVLRLAQGGDWAGVAREAAALLGRPLR
eukprot:scaffold2.g6979.t1